MQTQVLLDDVVDAFKEGEIISLNVYMSGEPAGWHASVRFDDDHYYLLNLYKEEDGVIWLTRYSAFDDEHKLAKLLLKKEIPFRYVHYTL